MTVINIRAILRGGRKIVFRAEATRVRASGVERKKETALPMQAPFGRGASSSGPPPSPSQAGPRTAGINGRARGTKTPTRISQTMGL